MHSEQATLLSNSLQRAELHFLLSCGALQYICCLLRCVISHWHVWFVSKRLSCKFARKGSAPTLLVLFLCDIAARCSHRQNLCTRTLCAMPVRLTSDSARETQGGRSRLRQLASFGRYGADMQASANSSSSQLPAAAAPTFRDCGVLAASLSSFYGWVAKQADHKVNFGKKSRDRLLTKQQVSNSLQH